MRRSIVGVLLLALVTLAAPAVARSRRPAPALRLDYAFTAHVDLYFLLRRAVAGEKRLPAGWAVPLESMRRAAAALSDPRWFGVVDAVVGDCAGVAELEQAATDVPEVGPGGIPLRTVVGHVAAAVRAGLPIYESTVAAERRAAVHDALEDRIKKVLVPREPECLDFLATRLALSLAPDRRRIPVQLVADAPHPGAFTSRSRRDGAVCFVAVRAHAGTTLFEVVLHEATHAMDLFAGPSGDSILKQLRRGLAAAGVGEDQPLYRDLPHTLMFVHAGETVRRIVAPEHVHYGDSHGYYAQLPAVAKAVRKHWIECLDGVTASAEAVRRMVGAVVAR